MKQRVVVGMSGGVDSSVSAQRLQEAGYDVIGLFMKNWEDEQGDCQAAVDYRDVEAVCRKLAIPSYAINLAESYHREVFAIFLAGLDKGWTPNPDLLCNRAIKFGIFKRHAQTLGTPLLATGHYARWTEHPRYGTCLARAVDRNKDQTYFLAFVPPEQLAGVLFPLGELQKSEVRQLAKQHQLPNAQKKDSVGICFIGKRPFAAFMKNHLATQPGEIRCWETEEVLGTHDGVAFYTLGQRKGLGIGGHPTRSGPWYVARKDVQHNRLYVVEEHDHPALFQQVVQAAEMNWLVPPPTTPFTGSAQCRYRQEAAPCSIEPRAEGSLQVRFEEPQWGVTPGQALVIYDGDICLGGGVIQ